MLSPRFLERLFTEAIPWSRRQMQPHLEKRLQIIRQLVGRHYGNNGAKDRVPMNYIRMQTSILSRHLVSRSPRCLVETRDPQFRALAKATHYWSSDLFDQLNLEKTLLLWNIEAILYPIGVIKVSPGITLDPMGAPDLASPRVDNVDAERMFWDMRATRWDNLHYIGHFCDIAKNKMQGPGWDMDRVAKAVPDPHNQIDEMGTERTEAISQDSNYAGSDLYDDLQCVEAYLPRENMTVICQVMGGSIDPRPLYQGEHQGPVTDTNCGPFHPHGFDPTPGNLLPSPPVHAIYDLHEAINVIGRKLLRQAQKQKTELLVQQAFKDEAKAVMDAPDGGVIAVTQPEAFTQVSWNGPNQQNMGALHEFKREISWHGGNFDAIGGLGPQSDTLGQDKLLSESSSKLLQYMQQEALSRTRELMRSICWYHWHSRRNLPYSEPIKGAPGQVISSSMSPAQRYPGGQSLFGRLQFSVHPYSMRSVTPELRIAQWMKLFQEVVMPMAPALMQQGQMVDVAAFARHLADLMDLPNYDEIVRMVPMPAEAMQAQGQAQAPPGMQGAPRVRPPGTGQYIRRNVGGEADGDSEVMRMMNQGDAA